MGPILVNPQALQMVWIAADTMSKAVSGIMAYAVEDPGQSVSWVQTGILGFTVAATVWGFKSGFLALGREVANRDTQITALQLENAEFKKTNIEMTATLTAVAVQLSGAVVPALGRTVQAARDVAPAEDQLGEVAALMRDVRERLDRDPRG